MYRQSTLFCAAAAFALLATSCTTILTFGDNTYSQMGLGSYDPLVSDFASPIQIDATVEVTLGSDHTCALRGLDDTTGPVDASSALWCWGENGSGQLGLGTTTDVTKPTQVGALETWQDVDAGGSHTCAILGVAGQPAPTDTGSMWCWGDNTYGQLGIGGTTSSTAAQQVGTDTDWKSVSAGEHHTCGVRSTTVYCWGRSQFGQLGDGFATDRDTPVAVSGVFLEVAAGGRHTCATRLVSFDTEVWCWGDNHQRQLGSSAGGALARFTPVQVPITFSLQIVSPSAGLEHACAAGVSPFGGGSTSYCWGANDRGQAGTGSFTPTADPTLVGSGVATAGSQHTCYIEAGNVSCFGADSDGQLGNGDPRADQPSPVLVSAGGTRVFAGGDSSCHLVSGNQLQCWGDNASGQVGDGTTTDRTSQKNLNFPASVVQTTAGLYHSCLRGGTGEIRCWGRNNNGQLGIGSTADTPRTTRVGTDTDWKDISAGGYNTCAVKTDETLWCWGYFGRLGTGGTTDATSPVQLPSAVGWATAGVGRYSSCAVKVDGTLWCWGDNAFGQLGDGTNTSSLTPVQVGAATDWASVEVGQTHACGLRTDDSLYCWGRNQFGQLGVGNFVDTNVPFQVDVSAWEAVSAGHDYTCGIKSDDSMWCWGNGADGRTGFGSTGTTNIPQQVGTDTDWAVVSANYRHTCGLRFSGGLIDKDLYCWGDNDTGQLGDGTNTDRLSPTFVSVPGEPQYAATGFGHTVIAGDE